MKLSNDVVRDNDLGVQDLWLNLAFRVAQIQRAVAPTSHPEPEMTRVHGMHGPFFNCFAPASRPGRAPRILLKHFWGSPFLHLADPATANFGT